MYLILYLIITTLLRQICSEAQAVALARKLCLPGQRKIDVCECGKLAYFDAVNLPDHQHGGSTHCPKCGAARFAADGVTPNHYVLYNPLQDLLSSVYTGDSDIDVKWNADQTFDQRRHMRDLFDSPGWKERVLSDKEFCKEPRHVVIRFSADGFPLFKDMSKRTAWAGASDVITMKAACRDKPEPASGHVFGCLTAKPKNTLCAK